MRLIIYNNIYIHLTENCYFNTFFIILSVNSAVVEKTAFLEKYGDKVAEWLRRWTANPFPSGSVGSNPILVESFLSSKHICRGPSVQITMRAAFASKGCPRQELSSYIKGADKPPLR